MPLFYLYPFQIEYVPSGKFRLLSKLDLCTWEVIVLHSNVFLEALQHFTSLYRFPNLFNLYYFQIE